jgi:hypothetical protein
MTATNDESEWERFLEEQHGKADPYQRKDEEDKPK